MDLTPVAHNAIPSSYNQRQRNAALSHLQAFTNQYNAALSSFAQAFNSEVAGGKAYYFDLANLVRFHSPSVRANCARLDDCGTDNDFSPGGSGHP